MKNIENVINAKLKNKILYFCIKISENIGKVEAKITFSELTLKLGVIKIAYLSVGNLVLDTQKRIS